MTRENMAKFQSTTFPTTSWTMISAAGGKSTLSPEALSGLCAAYWFPVFAFIRRKGHSREQAEDLTQAFFARVLEHNSIAEASRERGKFRSFLLASVNHFLSNEWDHEHAQKRGGECVTLSLDFETGEERYHREPCDHLTPELLFERHWALALLDLVLARLRDEYSRKGQAEQFDRMQPFLTGDLERGSYRQLAAGLNMGDGALRTAVHRLRRRFGELIRVEITAVVANPEEVEGEIRFLLAALGRR